MVKLLFWPNNSLAPQLRLLLLHNLGVDPEDYAEGQIDGQGSNGTSIQRGRRLINHIQAKHDTETAPENAALEHKGTLPLRLGFAQL